MFSIQRCVCDRDRNHRFQNPNHYIIIIIVYNEKEKKNVFSEMSWYRNIILLVGTTINKVHLLQIKVGTKIK